jgi:hypothetical protein
VELSVLVLTALTSLSQRWNTLSWLVGVVRVMLMALAEAQGAFYLLQDMPSLLALQLQ